MDAPPPAVLLERHAPLLRYATGERHGATAVEAVVAGPLRGARLTLRAPRGRRPDVTYARAVRGRDGRRWLTYWFLHEDNPQDRGVLRTGRHTGDWEVVQVGVDARTGRPQVVTFAQHGWAEGCAWEDVEHAGAAPVVHVAAASHASYPRAGTHGRPWPDPDDEADGRGRAVRPQVRPFGTWARYPGRWGGARARWFAPGESDSPRGPAFQAGGPHADPAGFHARARACGSGAPPHPPAVLAGAGALAAAVLAGLLGRAVRSRRRRSSR